MVESNLQTACEPLYRIEAAAMTTCGPVRSDNQDAIVLGGQVAQKSDTFLYKNGDLRTPFCAAVVDGMGGYAGGDEAACLAAVAFSKLDVVPDNALEADNYCNRLSEKITQAGHAWGMPEMGAAFAMLILVGNTLTVANVGDCRVYRYDASEDLLGLLTIDDRLANGKGGITQSLGGTDALAGVSLDAHYFTDQMREDNQFLLCSDGVWGACDDETLSTLLRMHSTAFDAARAIRHQCYEYGARDNCSAIVIRLHVRHGSVES